MKKIFFLLLITLSTYFITTSFSQTVTLNYSYANLSTSCNVFASATTLQTYSHQTSFGFPYYSQADGAIVLQSKPISFTNKGATQYAISYPFKQGYTYKIALYGKSVLGTSAAFNPSASISWSTSNGG